MTEEVIIRISRELYNKIKNRIELSQGEFKNVEEYVEFVLSEVVKESDRERYTPEEEEEIKERLRRLGYL